MIEIHCVENGFVVVEYDGPPGPYQGPPSKKHVAKGVQELRTLIYTLGLKMKERQEKASERTLQTSDTSAPRT